MSANSSSTSTPRASTPSTTAAVYTDSWGRPYTFDARTGQRLYSPEAIRAADAKRATTCGHCGGTRPIGQSCGCYDNNGQ